MNLDHAVHAVGHSCTRRTFLSIASDLHYIFDDDMRDDWTEAQVAAIRAARTFPPSLAARQVLGVNSAAGFLAQAVLLGLVAPWTAEKIEAVQVAVTPVFPGNTTAQASVLIGCEGPWLLRKARKLGFGSIIKGGCYMVSGERKTFPREPWSFTDEDVALVKSLLGPDHVNVKLKVPKPVYDAAVLAAQEQELVSPRELLERVFSE